MQAYIHSHVKQKLFIRAYTLSCIHTLTILHSLLVWWWWTPGLQSLLIDTVGFISELPLELVASFRATLEEVIAADLLLHVRDASTIGTSLFEAQRASVHRVLAEMGTPQHLSRSVIEVWNKVDVVERHSQGEDDHIIDDEQTQQRRKQEYVHMTFQYVKNGKDGFCIDQTVPCLPILLHKNAQNQQVRSSPLRSEVAHGRLSFHYNNPCISKNGPGLVGTQRCHCTQISRGGSCYGKQ